MATGLTRHMHLAAALALSIALGVLPSLALAQVHATIPVPAMTPNASPIRLEAFIYRPATAGPFPLVVLSHGSSGGNRKASLPASDLAAFFAERGFEVVVPMRRGRGQSTGVSREYEVKHCDPAAWEPGLDDAIEDLTAAIDYGRNLPGVDASHVVLVGVSRGGFLSVAYAARGPRRASVVGVVNFVGAWIAQAEDHCPKDFNALSFAQFGARTRVPMLWLYGDQDSYNTTPSILLYARRFRAAGGNLKFALIHRVPGNGHSLAGYPALWRDRVNAFVRQLIPR